MARYQNIFTQVQVSGPPELGLPLPKLDSPRTKGIGFSKLAGKIGNAQIGPIYLGTLGSISLATGTVAIVIMGLNMLRSVGWDPIAFVTLLPWLSLDPPTPESQANGFNPIVPLDQGGWWVIASTFLVVSVLLWWVRCYRRARALNMGTHVAWAFAGAIFLFLSLGFFQPLLLGDWSEAPPYGIISHLTWTWNFSVKWGNIYYNPFHCLSIVFLYGSVLLFAMHAGTILSVARYGGDRELDQIADRGTASERAALFWRWTMGFNASMESIHRWAWWFAFLAPVTGAIGILLSGTAVTSWEEFAATWHFLPYREGVESIPAALPTP